MTRESFLERWSRRKLDDEDMEVADEAEVEAGPETDASADRDGEPGDAAPEPHPTELVDIETLDYGSDFTQFMAKGVPVAVRRQALRKLWTSNPVLANMDGLNDYEDIVKTFGIKEIGNTAWKIGRGFLTDEDLGLSKPNDVADQAADDEVDAGMAADEPDTIEDQSDAANAVTPEGDAKAERVSLRRRHDEFDDTEEM